MKQVRILSKRSNTEYGSHLLIGETIIEVVMEIFRGIEDGNKRFYPSII